MRCDARQRGVRDCLHGHQKLPARLLACDHPWRTLPKAATGQGEIGCIATPKRRATCRVAFN